MPIDGTAPAFPLPLGSSDLGGLAPLDLDGGDSGYQASAGMTKREQIASQVLSALAAANPGRDPKETARRAVDFADALLEAL